MCRLPSNPICKHGPGVLPVGLPSCRAAYPAGCGNGFDLSNAMVARAVDADAFGRLFDERVLAPLRA